MFCCRTTHTQMRTPMCSSILNCWLQLIAVPPYVGWQRAATFNPLLILYSMLLCCKESSIFHIIGLTDRIFLVGGG